MNEEGTREEGEIAKGDYVPERLTEEEEECEWWEQYDWNRKEHWKDEKMEREKLKIRHEISVHSGQITAVRVAY